MRIKNIANGEVLNNIKIIQTSKVYSVTANESEVESAFENYLKDIGYGEVGKYYTKRTARSKLDVFPSKTGAKIGYPDYVFYENEISKKIIAIGDVKKPDLLGNDNSFKGINECIEIYLKEYNLKHEEKIKIAFGYDGFNFVIKYLKNIEKNEWVDIFIDDNPLTTMPQFDLLLSISKYGNMFSSQIEKNISKELLEPYFSQCDNIFRMAKSSLSAIDKAAEISIFIFLKIFSNDKLDEKFKSKMGKTIWEFLEQGDVDIVNDVFKKFLNEQYENVFPEKLIKVNEQASKDLARTINTMFNNCNIDRMTDVKGNALEYYQKDSKDRKIGEFFTPRHIIDLIISLVAPIITFEKDEENEFILDEFGNRRIKYIEKIYDPACGSGGFLIQSFLAYIDSYSKYGVTQLDLKKEVVFGNELKDSTVMLTKLNMILLGDGHNHISNENALSYKKFYKLEKVKENKKFITIPNEQIDYKVDFSGTEKVHLPYDKLTNELVIEEGISSNKVYFKAKIKMQKDEITPQIDFSEVKAVNDRVIDYHKSFFGKFDIVMANHPYALEEPSKADELFVKHMIESVKTGGRIACIVGEKLLFDNKHSVFREYLQNNITVESIISLPQGIFNPYTDVKTSILFLKKDKPLKKYKTWLVQMENDGFDLNTVRKPISENDIPRIIRLWEKWGGYFISDGKGEEIFKSYHKEEIGFAEFHILDKNNWCVKRYNTPLLSLNSKYNLVPIKNLLFRQKEDIQIIDNEQYKRITIQGKAKGIILRDIEIGSNIGTKNQFIVRNGQFLISKIDARNGAYGIIPEDLDGGIITGNFWTYKINEDLVLPEFLIYLMKHEFFIQMCSICSYGSTNRWYLDEDTFYNFKIPLPDKKEQKKIYTYINEIEKAKQLILNKEKDISNMINQIVGQ